MPRPKKDPNAPKTEMTPEQKEQLDRARANGLKTRKENAEIKKAQKLEEQELKKKEREEKLAKAKKKLNGEQVDINEPLIEPKRKPEIQEQKTEPIIEPKTHTPQPDPEIQKEMVRETHRQPKETRKHFVEHTKPLEKSAKEKYYEAKLKALSFKDNESKKIVDKNIPYNPKDDAHIVAKHNLNNHFNKELLRDMWKLNFNNENYPSHYY